MKKLSLYLSAFLVAMIAQVFLITTNADYTNVGGVCAVGTTGDFESALLSWACTTVKLAGNITIDFFPPHTYITRSLTLDGSGYSLISDITNATDANHADGIVVGSTTWGFIVTGVVIKNLTVVNISTATASNDKGNGIQIYDQAEAILENVTVSGFAKGGIYVRGTAVLSGTITTQWNGRYGVANYNSATGSGTISSASGAILNATDTTPYYNDSADKWVSTVTLPANFTAGKIYLPNGTFGLAAILSGAFAGGIVPYTTTETFTTVANAEAGIQVVGIFTLTPVNGVQVLRASGNTAPTEALTWSGNSAFFDSGIILTGRIDTFALTITHPGTYAYTMSFETLTGLVIDTTSGTIIVQASTIPTGSSGGGGLSKDNCPKGDNSPSYYDGTCGNSKDTTSQEPASTNDESSSNKAKENVSLEKCSIKGSTYPLEQNTAYLYACDQDITTMRTIQSARVEDQITRAELAKMISQYAISILGKKADLTKDCSAFSDSIASSSQDLQDHMILSCQLGLMGLKGNEYVIDDFRPNDYVTRAEFGTVFSRLLRDDKYQIMDDGPYYIGHLDALKKAGILINTDPNIFEIRGRIMLMMYRVSTSSID